MRKMRYTAASQSVAHVDADQVQSLSSADAEVKKFVEYEQIFV